MRGGEKSKTWTSETFGSEVESKLLFAMADGESAKPSAEIYAAEPQKTNRRVNNETTAATAELQRVNRSAMGEKTTTHRQG